MAEPGSSYSQQDQQPVTGPDLHAMETGQRGQSNSSTGGSSLAGSTAGRSSGGSSSSTGSKGGGVTDSTRGADGGATSSTKPGIPSIASLGDSESSPGFFNSDATGGFGVRNLKYSLWGTKGRRKKAIGGGITGVLLGGGVFAFIIASGPGQIIQLSQMLQRDFGNSQTASSNRANKLFRYATADDVGETRVGIIGRQFLRPAVQNLDALGIKFDLNPGAGLNSASIDTNKLKTKYTTLDHMSEEEQIGFLTQKFSIPEGALVAQGHGKFTVDASSFPLSSDKALVNSSLSALDNGGIVSAMNNRVFANYLNISTLFHPLSRAAESKLKKFATAAQNKSQTEDEEAALEQPVEAGADGAVSDVSNEESTFGDPVMKSLLLTGGACMMRGTAGDIDTINRDRIALPAMIIALHFISLGSQEQAGQDYSLAQIGAETASLTGSDGKSIWQGEALQATEGISKRSGTDIPEDYKQAFSGTSGSTIKKWADDSLGGSTIAAIACSGPGQLLQVVITLGGSALAAFGDVSSGGALTPAIVGLWALKEGESFAVSAVAMHFIQEFVLNRSTLGALGKDAFSGPVGGDLMAYGARTAGNLGSIASGGIELSNSAAHTLAYQQDQQDQQQFRSESLFARMFDINDYRSLTGQLADSISPSMTENFASATTSIGNLTGSLLSNMFSVFMPKTSAASPPYDWGFPEDGIPLSILNDPNMANPYTNSQDVANVLDAQCLNADGSVNASCNYIKKVSICFGDSIEKDSSGTWDVVPDHLVDTSSDDYKNAGCDDTTSDGTWKRIILFVNDTRNGQSMACFEGDQQACQEIDYSGGSTATTTSPSGSGGGVTVDNQDAQKVAQQASTGGVNVGYALYDASGNLQAHYNDTFQNYGASITKSMLLVAYLKQVGSGSLSSEATSELTNMIENSDNASADWVYSHINNSASAVNDVASSAGMSGFQLNDSSDPIYVLGQSKITANDFAKFFSKIDTMLPSSQKSFGLGLLSHLASTDQNGLLQAGLPGTVYSKEGWKPESSGLEGAPYIVNQAAQFSSDGTTYGVAVTVGGTTDQASGETIVKNVVSALIKSN